MAEAQGADPATQPGAHGGPAWWAPTPRLLAFSCRNLRNLVRKMYLEASPFGRRTNEAVNELRTLAPGRTSSVPGAGLPWEPASALPSRPGTHTGVSQPLTPLSSLLFNSSFRIWTCSSSTTGGRRG